jgi:hypothetical protein
MSPILDSIGSVKGFGWGALGSVGTFDSISTTTVGVGGASTITFSAIPSTFKHLQIRGISRTTTATGDGDPYHMQFNSDTANNYAWHTVQGYVGATSDVNAGATTTTSNMRIGYSAGANNSANMYESSITDILDYGNTSKYKTIRTLEGFDANNDGPGRYYAARMFSGLWQSTNAISNITITAPNGSFAQYSQFALYGIKGE